MVGYVTKRRENYNPQTKHQTEIFEVEKNFLLSRASKRKRVVVQKHGRLKVQSVRERHERSYLSATKTRGSLSRRAFWRGMYDKIGAFCASFCCSEVIEKLRKQPGRALQPHDIPGACLNPIRMDFLTELSLDENEFHADCTQNDTLLKRAAFSAKKIQSTGAAKLLQRLQLFVHRVLKSFVVDRNLKFTWGFWRWLTSLLGVQPKLLYCRWTPDWSTVRNDHSNFTWVAQIQLSNVAWQLR